ncbi:MAG: hypothetical protein PHX21_02685 [bacterium]|nr:hypothetical protein [bacterium]
MLKRSIFAVAAFGILFFSGQVCTGAKIQYDNGTPKFVKGYDPM